MVYLQNLCLSEAIYSLYVACVYLLPDDTWVQSFSVKSPLRRKTFRCCFTVFRCSCEEGSRQPDSFSCVGKISLTPDLVIWVIFESSPQNMSLRAHINGLWLCSVLWEWEGAWEGWNLEQMKSWSFITTLPNESCIKRSFYWVCGEMGCPCRQRVETVRFSWLSVCFPVLGSSR